MTSIKEDMEDIKRLVDEIKPYGWTPDNGYGERELSDGRIKNTVTGVVTEPVTRDLDEADRQLPESNRGF